MGKPDGYILQSGYEIQQSITLEPYTSIVLKKSDTPISYIHEKKNPEQVFLFPTQ